MKDHCVVEPDGAMIVIRLAIYNHVMHLPSLAGLFSMFSISLPALKRWAIVNRPDGTKTERHRIFFRPARDDRT